MNSLVNLSKYNCQRSKKAISQIKFKSKKNVFINKTN